MRDYNSQYCLRYRVTKSVKQGCEFTHKQYGTSTVVQTVEKDTNPLKKVKVLTKDSVFGLERKDRWERRS